MFTATVDGYEMEFATFHCALYWKNDNDEKVLIGTMTEPKLLGGDLNTLKFQTDRIVIEPKLMSQFFSRGYPHPASQMFPLQAELIRANGLNSRKIENIWFETVEKQFGITSMGQSVFEGVRFQAEKMS